MASQKRFYRWVGGIAFVLLSLILAAVSIATLSSTRTSSANISTTPKLRLPQIAGDALNGTPLSFPNDFDTPLNIVAMPFTQEQQVQVADYLPLFEALARENANVAYYNIALLPDLAPAFRFLVVTGMQAGTRDEVLRGRSTAIFLENQAEFLSALDIPNTETMRVFVFAQNGDLLGEVQGAYSEENARALRDLVAP
jgi:hypothetical protein